MKLLRLKAPVLLEGEGAGIGLAAAEIEHPCAAVLRAAAHHLPVHHIGGGEAARFPRAAAVIGQYLLLEVEGEYRGDRPAIMQHRGNVRFVWEGLEQRAEIMLGEDRAAEVAHAFRIDAEKRIGISVGVGLKAALRSLAHLGALLARNVGGHVLGIVAGDGGDRLAEGVVKRRPFHPARIGGAKAAIFQAGRTELRLQLEGMRIERGAGLRRGGDRAAVDAVGRGGEQFAEQQRLHAR